jgi:hypothetical protein
MEIQNRYGFIETWSSARWVREPNPYFGMIYNIQKGKYVSAGNGVELFPLDTIRLNNITGEWELTPETYDE